MGGVLLSSDARMRAVTAVMIAVVGLVALASGTAATEAESEKVSEHIERVQSASESTSSVWSPVAPPPGPDAALELPTSPAHPSSSCVCAAQQLVAMDAEILEPARSQFLATLPAMPLDQMTEADLEELNEKLDKASPLQVLMWLQQAAGHMNVTQFTSFGISGLCITDMLSKLEFSMPIVFVDTLYHFNETLELLERVEHKYGRNITRFRPKGAQTRAEFEAMHGTELWRRDPDAYQVATKVEPTARALRALGVQVWITGRRRSQGDARSSLRIVERQKDGRYKVNPMAWWGWETVWAYIREHDVPYNVLLDRGYKSVGDVHSTVPVGSDAPERAGRWVGDHRTECGMHTILEAVACDDEDDSGSTSSAGGNISNVDGNGDATTTTTPTTSSSSSTNSEH